MDSSGNKTCTDDELRLIAVRVAESLRKHPEVNGGVSVRATLSFLEVLEAFGRIDGSISLDAVYDSAFSTFGGRLSSKGWRDPDEILQEVLDDILLGKKPQVMRFGPQSLNEEAAGNLRDLIRDLMKLSVTPQAKKTGVYPEDLSELLETKEGEEGNSSLSSLMEALWNALYQSMLKGNSSSVANDFLKNLENFNLMRRDSARGMGNRYKFTKGAVKLVGEKTAREILGSHYDELVDNDTGEAIGESLSQEELANLLNELQSILEMMQHYGSGFPIEAMLKYYGNQFPTLSKLLEKLAPMLNHAESQLERSSRISEALETILEALAKERYLDEKDGGLTLSSRSYELIFGDVLPEVDQVLGKGEHDALSGSGNEEDIVDVRRYRRGDRFRDVAVGATVREMVKHHRRQPVTGDLMANQSLPRRSLDIALAIDSSRSMAQFSKLHYAKKAAMGLAMAASRRGDRVGVLSFSDFARKVTDLTGDVDQQFLKRVAELRAPHRSTNVEDALKKAAQVLNRTEIGGHRHIILVTDGVPTSSIKFPDAFAYQHYASYYGPYFRGISMDAAYAQAKRCVAQGITISTICIDRGEHVDREFCRNLSRLGKGRVYFIEDEHQLLKTTLREYLSAKDYKRN